MAEDPPQVFISLYERGDLPQHVPLLPGMFGFHWALIPIPNYLTIADMVVEYTILKGSKDKSWRHGHRMIRKVSHDPHLHICIALPPIIGGLSVNDLVGAFAEQPPEQGETPLLDLHNEWSSAQWCIRVLRCLVEVELIDLPLETEADCALFYRRISSIGTAAGISTLPFTLVDGVKVVDYH